MGIRYKMTTAKFFVLLVLFVALALFTATSALASDPSTGLEPGGAETYEDYINRVGTPTTGQNLKDAFDPSSGKPLNATAVQGVGFNTSATFQTIVSTIITMVLSLMGVIFLILAIYSGFKWMTAGGNEEAVEKAKKTMVNAVIGLVVVLASYVLARFIVELFGRLVFTMQS